MVLRRGGEIFQVDLFRRPAVRLGPAGHVIDEAGRPAHIEVGAGVGRDQQAFERQLLRGRPVVEMEVHAAGERRAGDLLAEGGAFRRTGAVVQFEIRGYRAQPLRHAQQRGHADAPCEEQAALRVVQRKVVARFADVQDVAFAHGVVHGHRAAARGRVAQHGDAIAMLLERVVAQRILAGEAARHLHVDVRAGAEGGQGAAVDRGQFEAHDAFGFHGLAHHGDGEAFHVRRGRAVVGPATVPGRSAGPGCGATAHRRRRY